MEVTAVEKRVIELKSLYWEKWVDRDDSYWLQRLMQEVGEAASVLAGDHDDTLDHELEQIATIAMNWLEKIEERKRRIVVTHIDQPLTLVKPLATRTLIAYCDGGASPNPGNGGYGYIFTEDEKKILFEGHNTDRLPNSTNNQMETLAAIAALEALYDQRVDLRTIEKVVIRSDSKYLIFTGRGDWKVSADNELTRSRWRDLFRLLANVPFAIEWEHIARDSDWFNKRADLLSNKVR